MIIATMNANNVRFGLPTVTTHEQLDMPVSGAMGKASNVGLGLALAQPDRKVIVLDGDGSLLMNLGAMVTLANKTPTNLCHMLFDNGVYAVTGGQPVPGSGKADWEGLAKAAGYAATFSFDDLEDLTTGIAEVSGRRRASIRPPAGHARDRKHPRAVPATGSPYHADGDRRAARTPGQRLGVISGPFTGISLGFARLPVGQVSGPAPSRHRGGGSAPGLHWASQLSKERFDAGRSWQERAAAAGILCPVPCADSGCCTRPLNVPALASASEVVPPSWRQCGRWWASGGRHRQGRNASPTKRSPTPAPGRSRERALR